MRLSFTEMAHVQKLDFGIFVDEWMEKHEICCITQYAAIYRAMLKLRWDFFIDELIEYYSKSDLYKVYDDSVELLEY